MGKIRTIGIRVSVNKKRVPVPIIRTVNASLISAVKDTDRAQALAALCGGVSDYDSAGPQVVFPEGALNPSSVYGGWVAPIADLGVLCVAGDDALRFLQSQLTNDLEGLPEGAWQLSGYCSAKGRLLASLTIWPCADGIRILASQPLVSGLRKRLAMFVLRAKVRITDESDRWTLFGVGGERASISLANLGASLPAQNHTISVGASHVLGFATLALPDPSAGSARAMVSRSLLLVPVEDATRTWAALSAELAAAPSALWRWTEVLSGAPRIVPAGVERFVPQMVNLDLVNGVSFRKGCYPGQEVVARSHYLGKLKRRMFLAQVDGNAPESGTDVHGPGGSEPCGEVVLSAPSPFGGARVLFESQIASAHGARLPDGRSLTLVDLPYEFPGG